MVEFWSNLFDYHIKHEIVNFVRSHVAETVKVSLVPVLLRGNEYLPEHQLQISINLNFPNTVGILNQATRG